MTILAVPAAGLSLTGAPDMGMDIVHAKPKQKPSQAFCVDLPIALVEELRKYATGKPNGVQLACGRSPSLKFGGRSIDLCSTPQSFRQELYRSSSAEGNSKLNYAAIMSHKLQVQQVERATKGVDAALLALQNNMAALEKEKKSNTTVFAKDRSALGVTAKSGKIQYNSGRLPSNGSHRSMPTSPSLAASKAPVRPPTSVPQDQHTMRVQAVRKVLIHLLAIEPLSEAALLQRTKARSQEVAEILEKCAERIESNTKWQLDKRSYRELDVWKFAYPTREDRQAAIDHAAAAFDRLRLSREDKLWQLLLPQKDRGKGIVLSKLHLHNGPIARSSTPTIRVQGTKESGSESEAKRWKASESESDRRARDPSPGMRKDSGSDRSPSSAAMKQKKVNDRGTPSTRLLPPKGTKSSAKATEKAKPAQAPRASTKSDRGGVKVKSAEYIDDSDEDASMADVAETKPKSKSDARTLLKTTKSKVTKSGQQYHKVTKPAPGGSPRSVLQGVKLGRVAEAVAGASADRVGSRAAEASVEKYRAALEEAAADAGLDVKASKMSKSSPRSKTATSTKESSTSKITSGPNRPTSKPSPLGSSPPTNASELDSEAVNDSSTSSSSTPLISQVRSRPRSNTPRATSASKAVGALSTARPVNGLKRKAEENAADRRATTVSNKRHQVPTSGGGGGSSSSITSPPPSSATSVTNSVTSQPSSRQNSSSASPVTSYNVLQLARKFKEHYAGYEKLYRELVVMADPPREKVERVKEMHAKLEGMKFEISRSAAS